MKSKPQRLFHGLTLTILFTISYSASAFYDPTIGRWISRDPIKEQAGVNLYGFVANTPVNALDVRGLAKRTVRYVGKSFINGVGPLGSLGNRVGLRSPPGIISVNGVALGAISGDGQYADQRLAILASLVGGLAAFNQNPLSDAQDGQYRLYGKVEIAARCCGSILTSYSYDTDKEGGNELPGINGTINMDVDDGRGAWGFSLTSATVTWKTWGRPNLLVEPGMQWVALRTSVNIWHEGKVKITCSGGKPIFTLLSFRGSRYPSRRLWEDGALIRNVRQGSFSDLWQAESWWQPTMVAD
jgi:RHS repeat-associated protein